MRRRRAPACASAPCIGSIGPAAGALARIPALALACVALSATCPAQAHEGAATSFASITVAKSRVLYSLTTSSRPLAQTDAQGSAQGETPADPARMATLVARHVRIEADGGRCLPGAVDFEPPSPPRISTTYNVEFRCAAPIRKLRFTDDLFDVIGRGTHTLLRASVEGREEPLAAAVMLADEQRSAEFVIGPVSGGRAQDKTGPSRPDTDSAATASRGTISFFPLGVRHIVEGWDHLLFLLALMLPGGSLWSLARIVTAFTFAHSLTLAAAALEWVSVPAAPVEALIALSIAWVAAENLVRMRPMSRRWVVAFAFGLIHGFGFANVLRDIGLPPDALLSSLVWFNLGIELGQLLVVTLLVPALAWLSRRRHATPVPQALSALILVASVVLLVHRL